MVSSRELDAQGARVIAAERTERVLGTQAEIQAMADCAKALAPLRPDARLRALRWLTEFYAQAKPDAE